VSIRPGWFHHPAEDDRVKSVDELAGLYFSSVGRNSKLLLNVPPTRSGLLHATDVERLRGMRGRLDALFAADRLPDLGADPPPTVSIADLREDIARGQSVARYRLEGRVGDRWRVLSRGTTIGYRKIDTFDPTPVSAMRLEIEKAVGEPVPVRVGLYEG
jgi:alpha-L-fucosidase